MSPLIRAHGMLAASKRRPRKARDTASAEAPAARSHVAVIKRFSKVAVATALVILVVSGIVALTSFI